ncbi:hypothetical protein EAH_00053370, partial [Eimeria acervulina]
ELLEASFAILPEDGPPTKGQKDSSFGAAAGAAAAAAAGRSRLTEKERAQMQYAAFSDEEKLQLIEEKLQQLTQQIERDVQLRGAPKDLLLVQLRDHLEAAKQAYLEGKYIEETKKRLQQQQEQQQQEQQQEEQQQGEASENGER